MKCLFLLSLLFLSACALSIPEEKQAPVQSCPGPDCLQMDKEACLGAGGKWNDCGSPCLGTNADVCIEMCSAQCECGEGKYNCPEGYSCRTVGGQETELGACVKS